MTMSSRYRPWVITIMIMILLTGQTLAIDVAIDAVPSSSSDASLSAISSSILSDVNDTLTLEWQHLTSKEQSMITTNCDTLRDRLSLSSAITSAHSGDERMDNMEAFESSCLAFRGRPHAVYDYWLAAQYMIATWRAYVLDDLTRTTAANMAHELLATALTLVDTYDHNSDDDGIAALRLSILQATSNHIRATQRWSDAAVDIEWQLLAHALQLPVDQVRPLPSLPFEGLGRIPSLITRLHQNDARVMPPQPLTPRQLEDRLDERRQAARQLVTVATQSRCIWSQLQGLEWCIALAPSSPALHAELAGVAYGYGQFYIGVQHAIMDVALQWQSLHDASLSPPRPVRRIAMKPRTLWHGIVDDELMVEVHRLSLILFTVGLEAHTVSVARSMLHGTVIARTISDSCGYTLARADTDTNTSNNTSNQEYTRDELVGLVLACVHRSDRDAITYLLQHGGSVTEANFFGWQPLHHAVSIGDVITVRALLAAGADVNGVTVTGLTPLHVAALRGGGDHVVQLLLQSHARVDQTDDGGRTALDLIMLHHGAPGWTPVHRRHFCRQLVHARMSAAPAAEARWSAKHCDTLDESSPGAVGGMRAPTVTKDTNGGWPMDPVSSGNGGDDQRCDIEVRSAADLTVDDFIRDYLSIERPVLIRGVLHHDQLTANERHAWTRLKHALSYDGMHQARLAMSPLTVGTIPYSAAFGMADNRTTLGTYLKYLATNPSSSSSLDMNPSYIFESLVIPPDYEPPLASASPSSSKSLPASSSSALNSALMNVFTMPSFLAPDRTNITTRKVQFYLGPPHSGAPVHFHRSAWNLLVYGEKQWYMFPPHRSFYSKQPIATWLHTRASSLQGEWQALQCVQSAGDLIYVPDLWAHGVINRRTSIGFASEFLWGATHFVL